MGVGITHLLITVGLVRVSNFDEIEKDVTVSEVSPGVYPDCPIRRVEGVVQNDNIILLLDTLRLVIKVYSYLITINRIYCFL